MTMSTRMRCPTPACAALAPAPPLARRQLHAGRVQSLQGASKAPPRRLRRLVDARAPPIPARARSHSIARAAAAQPPASPQAPRAPRAVAVAVDTSPDSRFALRWTMDNLLRRGDVVHLLHVIPAPPSEVRAGRPRFGRAPGASAASTSLYSPRPEQPCFFWGCGGFQKCVFSSV
jgi:hypothetical protein